MKATVDSVQLSRAVSHVTRVLDPDHTALSVRAADGGLVFEAVGEGYSRASVQADVHIVTEGDCFDPRTCCDEREQALIAALRAYLRPDVAPECLMARLKATLDHCCGEDK